MSSYVAARAAAVNLIHAAWVAQYPTVPIFYENTVEVDLDTVGDRFLRFEMQFDDAQQMTVNDTPEHRTYGTLVLSVFAKEGTGTLAVLDMLDFLTNVAKFEFGSGLSFWTPTPGRKQARNGWVSQDLLVPFQFHTMG